MAYKRRRTRLTPSTYRTTTYKTDGSIHTSTTTKMGNQTWTESEKGKTHTINTDGWITTRSQRRRKPRKNRELEKFFKMLFSSSKKKPKKKVEPQKSEMPRLETSNKELEEYNTWFNSLTSEEQKVQNEKLKTEQKALKKLHDSQERLGIFVIAAIGLIVMSVFKLISYLF